MELDYSTLCHIFDYRNAAASYEISKSGMYLLSHLSGSFVEKIENVEGETVEAHLVGSNVRRSPALRLVDQSQRRIFYADNDNLLCCSMFQQTAKRWENVPLSPLSVHPHGKLSGAFQEDGDQLVFFENRQSQISTIRVKNGDTGNYQEFPSPPVKLMPTASHRVLVGLEGGKDLHFFYVHRDGKIHRSRIQNYLDPTGTWEGMSKFLFV
ncbi:hypothetical protein VTH82DRAFT_5924 [Thermothelomyces myriococcoides]